MTKIFLDSNIVIYAFGQDHRAEVAKRLLSGGATISIQILNEFVNVARRKLRFEWAKIEDSLASIRTLVSEIQPLNEQTHADAVKLAQRYGFSFYDALIVAAALKARCDVLCSEDMQHGLEIEGRLVIQNPFLHIDS